MVKHGCGKDRLYRIWNAMIQRCCNPRYKQFPSYGGRGITVHQSWLPPATEGYLKFREDVLAIAKEQGLGSAQIEWLEGKSGGAKSGEGFGQGAKESELPVKLTLDRKDNDGGYNPANCHWVPYNMQGYNRRGGTLNRRYRIGVTWVEGKQKFKAYATQNNVNYHLGYFNTEDEAVARRVAWEIEHGVGRQKI